MATLTITSIRPAQRNVAIASLLDKTRQTRSKSSPAALDRQTDLQTSTPRTIDHPCPGEHDNFPPTCGAAAIETHLGRMGGRHECPVQRRVGQAAVRDIYIYIYIYIYIEREREREREGRERERERESV